LFKSHHNEENQAEGDVADTGEADPWDGFDGRSWHAEHYRSGHGREDREQTDEREA
jgi:hypothetical protein